MISSFKPTKKVANYTHIEIEGIDEVMKGLNSLAHKYFNQLSNSLDLDNNNNFIPHINVCIIVDFLLYTSFTDEMNTLFDVTDMSTLTMLHDLYTMGITITNFTLTHPKMKAFIQSEQNFDVVLLDIFLDEALLGLGHRFNAPIIGVSTLGACKWTTDLVGSPSPLSYVPHPLLR